MFFSAEYDSAYGADYSYRMAKFKRDGVKLAGYEHERYDGTDEADHFRVESTGEMREKAVSNSLLPSGPERVELRRERELAEVESVGTVTMRAEADGSKPVVGRYVPPQRRSRGKHVAARKLDLHAILTDSSIQVKYNLDSRSVAELRAVREESPGLAADLAKSMLHERGFTGTDVVTNTECQYTKAEAVKELAYLAATEGVKSCLVDTKVTSTSLAGDKIYFLSGPYVPETIHDHEWEVICPITRAKSGLDYYKLLVALGHDECFARAGIAAGTLGISIHHNSTVPLLLHPTVQYHAARPGADIGYDLSGFDKVDTRAKGLMSVIGAIAPLTRERSHTAYTVAVAGGGRLLNEHVRAKAATTKFCGKELRKFQTFRLRGDLWFFYDTSTAAVPPAQRSVARTRTPVDGESVRLLLPCPGDSGVCYLGPVGSISPGFDGAWCVDSGNSLYAQPGMSGLPLIAEADGALVAVHDGLVLGKLRVLAVPANMSCDVVVEQAISRMISFSSPSAKTIAHVDLDPLKKTKVGRGNLAALVDALDNIGDRTLFSCYGQRSYIAGSSGGVVPPGMRFGMTATGAEGRVSELPLRAPVPADRVVIVGKTDVGMYVTPVLSMGEVIGEALFSLDLGGELGQPHKDFFNGAAVLALDDARVVGFVSAKGMTILGASHHTLLCWACSDIPLDGLPVECASPSSTTVSSGMFSFNSMDGSGAVKFVGPATVGELRSGLERIFPDGGFDDASVYRDSDIDEVFSHPSLGSYLESTSANFSANGYWARMGDSALSYMIMRDMMRLAVPAETSTIKKSSIQNNANQAKVACRLGLDKLYRFKAGANLGEHNLADLLEAVMGLVAERKGLPSEAAEKMYRALEMGCPFPG